VFEKFITSPGGEIPACRQAGVYTPVLGTGRFRNNWGCGEIGIHASLRNWWSNP